MSQQEVKAYFLDFKHMFEDQVDRHFVLGDDYWEKADCADITSGSIDVDAHVKQMDEYFVLDVKVHGDVVFPCDRCLDEFPAPIEANLHLLVQLGPEDADIDDDIIAVNEVRGTLDLASLVKEMIAVSLPLVHVHPDGECNKEMIKRLADLSVTSVSDEEENISGDTFEDDDSDNFIDPRWNELKKIKDNK